MSIKLGECTVLPDITRPNQEQTDFKSRLLHFFTSANPLNLLLTDKELEHAKGVILDYRRGKYDRNMTVEELYREKSKYDSAFHPDTGEKMFILGRMSAQVPCNMVIVGCMLTFYKKNSHIFVCHLVNQTFNAVVNYTNRSGFSKQDDATLFKSYVAATSGALACALGSNALLHKFQRAPRYLLKFVPFVSIAIANAINIPMMRHKEFTEGIPVEDEMGRSYGNSIVAPKYAIPQVVLSRVGMGAPNMILGPILFTMMAKSKKYRNWMAAPLQTMICGFMLVISTPFCCAIFPQKASIQVTKLEPSIQAKVNRLRNPPTVLYYNKGL